MKEQYSIILVCSTCGTKLKDCCIMNCSYCKDIERYCFNCSDHRAIDVEIKNYVKE